MNSETDKIKITETDRKIEKRFKINWFEATDIRFMEVPPKPWQTKVKVQPINNLISFGRYIQTYQKLFFLTYI